MTHVVCKKLIVQIQIMQDFLKVGVGKFFIAFQVLHIVEV